MEEIIQKIEQKLTDTHRVLDSLEQGKVSESKVHQTRFSFEEIKNLLPHRYPMLMIDRVLHVDEESILCIKNVTGDEPFFQGHFPGIAIMPGVLMTEAMAQASLLLVKCRPSVNPSDYEKKQILLRSTDVKFLNPVVPGDQLLIKVKADKLSSIGCIVQCHCEVDGKIVVKGKLTAALK